MLFCVLVGILWNHAGFAYKYIYKYASSSSSFSLPYLQECDFTPCDSYIKSNKGFYGIYLFLNVCTLSCCLTRWRSQDEAFSLITLRMGCQFSEMSEPSVTDANTLTCRSLLPWLLGILRIYRDCFPTSLRGFRYKLHKERHGIKTGIY